MAWSIRSFILGTTKFDLYAYSELGCVPDKAENRPSTDVLVTMLKIRTAEIPRPQEYNYYNKVKFLSEEAAAASSLLLRLFSTYLVKTLSPLPLLSSIDNGLFLSSSSSHHVFIKFCKYM